MHCHPHYTDEKTEASDGKEPSQAEHVSTSVCLIQRLAFLTLDRQLSR